ncbi:MAG TPA: SLC13 family permease, partial [Pirellulaceae bacterium]|nr:SLC13 family permease [Pirellulaceae bacterium]
MTQPPLPPGVPRGPVATAGLVLAVPLAIVTYFAVQANMESPTHAACATAAIATLMGTLWITEALPLAATSLLPLVLFPLMDVLTFKQAAAPYVDNLVYVYFGGFLLALAIERWNLHRRLALHTLLLVGTRPALLVGGLMLATCGISMWISNTATTAMMLPLGLSLVTLIMEQAKLHQVSGLEETDAKNFATCMMLGIAYASTIGGLGTLIGTPTNAFLAGFARENGIEIGFARWMLFAIPIVIVYMVVTWLLLTKLLFRLPRVEVPNSAAMIRGELHKLGAVTRGECVVFTVFSLTALLWLFREPITHWPWLLAQWPAIKNLDDGVIALSGALVLFAIPINLKQGVFALDWATAVKMPWAILLLFGGGLSLAAAVTASKLA